MAWNSNHFIRFGGFSNNTMLKDFVKSSDWQQIQLMFYEEMDRLSKTIPYKDKDLEQVGKQYVARQEAIDIIKRVLRRIETVSKDVEVKKESFR
jgi:translation initiation factor 2B subunit (eIF-2B alpha/beta/delta family)